jgi:hypothetical protein
MRDKYLDLIADEPYYDTGGAFRSGVLLALTGLLMLAVALFASSAMGQAFLNWIDGVQR